MWDASQRQICSGVLLEKAAEKWFGENTGSRAVFLKIDMLVC